ncbi:Cu(I)-responsive transcriptional regulator [Loktanella ponticola]|uniref:Cu(I)-responsive transcriptional regulator n=1 Tax=Yoonia ponticola TaxID=1524255 RepID=A0A7W9EWP6_9RHOB|nr:Cu(I)-responsive transcriptional regulator [Yoonia ponticola]MBB5720833.1 Cu(I)-responsive transcriptional regulator [Yoonia ponticola]
MNIGDASKQSNLPPKTIRYYEDIGLIKPLRDANGYRSFRDRDIHKLVFLARSRALGFTIEDCRNLLALWDDQTRASADVRAIAKDHLSQIENKITDLQAIHSTLSQLVHDCAGDHRPDCPILKTLETFPKTS